MRVALDQPESNLLEDLDYFLAIEGTKLTDIQIDADVFHYGMKHKIYMAFDLDFRALVINKILLTNLEQKLSAMCYSANCVFIKREMFQLATSALTQRVVYQFESNDSSFFVKQVRELARAKLDLEFTEALEKKLLEN